MQSSSEQPLVGEERYVTTRITAAKETTLEPDLNSLYCYFSHFYVRIIMKRHHLKSI